MMIIAGYGFVGKAYEIFFKGWGDQIKIVDPKYNQNTIGQDTTQLIVCVPTPQGIDGACDISDVMEVVQAVPDHARILIKSTISLDGWNILKETFPQKELCFSPEFLRAGNYLNDIKNTDTVILSGNCNYWADQYRTMAPHIKQHIILPEEAIMIKYFRNAFLATKVSFFNHVYDMCAATGIDFDQVRAGIAEDVRIGHSHTYVEQRGWNGMCFPKDTAALLKMAADNNINLNTIEAAVDYNKIIKKIT